MQVTVRRVSSVALMSGERREREGWDIRAQVHIDPDGTVRVHVDRQDVKLIGG